MRQLASPGQLRAALLRWSLVTVPACLALGWLSAMVSNSGPGNAWFAGLVKPPIYPPPIAFPVVWSALYIAMGLAFAMILAARGAPGRGMAAIAFAIQFALNLAWSPLFFGAHRMSAALVLLGLLDLAVIVTLVLFRRVRPLAATLLLPYLAWILFATVLNYEFLAANPDADGRLDSGAVSRIAI